MCMRMWEVQAENRRGNRFPTAKKYSSLIPSVSSQNEGVVVNGLRTSRAANRGMIIYMDKTCTEEPIDGRCRAETDRSNRLSHVAGFTLRGLRCAVCLVQLER